MTVRSPLIDLLVEHRPLSAADLDQAVRTHMDEGGSLAQILLNERLVSEDDLFFLMSRRLGVPAIPEARLQHLTLSPELRRRVPRSLARACVLIPLDLDYTRGLLSVAMFDPTDWDSLTLLRNTSRVAEVKCYLARRSAVLCAIGTVYTDEDEHSDVDSLEPLPARAGGPALAAEGAKDTAIDEPKVEIDPSLAQEIEALSREGGSEPDSGAHTPVFDIARTIVRAPLRDEVREADEGGSLAVADEGITQVRGMVSYPPAPERRGPIPRAVTGRSLLRFNDDVRTDPFGYDPAADAPLEEVELTELPPPMPMDAEEDDGDDGVGDDGEDEEQLDREPTHVTKADSVTARQPVSLPDIPRLEELDALVRELLSSVGVLISMLEERIDPVGQGYREYGRVSRMVAREMGMDEIAIDRVALAAHLYGLDIALRQEVGIEPPRDVRIAFGVQPAAPGGLGPSLRKLGAKALGLAEDNPVDPLGVKLIRLVADYLELKEESAEASDDVETVAQLLRTGGADPVLLSALVRALESAETGRVRLIPEGV